jgi:hypothetical protein
LDGNENGVLAEVGGSIMSVPVDGIEPRDVQNKRERWTAVENARPGKS